jgi:alpha-tubulin suppressor-like RCC1 family protein
VFALTSEGQLMFAQVRRKSDLVIHEVELHPLKELEGEKIVQISTRYGQAFAVAEDGAVYAWGMKTGDPHRREHICSMGLGEITTLLHPTSLPSFGSGHGQTPVRFVSAGVSHTIFTTIFGEVYTVGRGDSGKLGLGQTSGVVHQVLRPAKVHFDSRPAPAVVAAAAGARHSLFLTNTGEVWGCGLAQDGQLPTSATPDNNFCFWTPKRMDRLDSFCTAVAAGISLSFFVGECGEVYFSGIARQTSIPFGRTPHANPWDPVQIPGLSQIEHVSVSMELSFYQWEHAIFARRGGRLFAWGHVGHGEFNPKGRTGGAGAGSRSRSRNAAGFHNCVLEIDNWPGARDG